MSCPRCGSPTIPGVRCHRCAVDSERALELVAAMRRFAGVMAWIEVEAWSKGRTQVERSSLAIGALVRTRMVA